MKYPKASMLPIICVLLIAIVVPGCKKDSNGKTTAHSTANAIIINTGPVAADGCGWLVKINGTNQEYSPVNLSSTYQIDSLKVNITYHVLTTRFSCGNLAGNPGIAQIQLDAISK